MVGIDDNNELIEAVNRQLRHRTRIGYRRKVI